MGVGYGDRIVETAEARKDRVAIVKLKVLITVVETVRGVNNLSFRADRQFQGDVEMSLSLGQSVLVFGYLVKLQTSKGDTHSFIPPPLSCVRVFLFFCFFSRSGLCLCAKVASSSLSDAYLH